MVRAILAGTKTQTRRVVKPVGNDGGFVLMGSERGWWPYRSDDGESSFHSVRRNGAVFLDETPHACPYGQPGDRLWVRETWAEVPRAEPRTDEDSPWRDDGRIMVYRADPEWEGARQFLCADGVLRWAKPDHWRPSIHMPRWASRITLEITDVRVERLQAISEADAIAEGCSIDPSAEGEWRTNRDQYEQLWNSLHGDHAWAANPWVWVVAFRRAEAAR